MGILSKVSHTTQDKQAQEENDTQKTEACEKFLGGNLTASYQAHVQYVYVSDCWHFAGFVLVSRTNHEDCSLFIIFRRVSAVLCVFFKSFRMFPSFADDVFGPFCHLADNA